MLYRYLAADKTGKIQEGDYDADNVGVVLQYLAGKELRPINVTAAAQNERSVTRSLFGGIKTGDKIFLTKYLALMLRVGTDLLSAINILLADFEKPAMRNILYEIRDNLSKGRQFYEAFENHPKEFSSVFVNLVKAAEASGNLQQMFDEMSVSLQREAELQGRVSTALIYPAILLLLSGAVTAFLVTFAIPRIADVFSESGITPPLFSQVVFAIGPFMNAHIVAILILIFVIIVPGIVFLWTNMVGRRLLEQFMSKAPVVSGLYRDIAIQRFASTLSALLKAGLPILNAIRITADVVGAVEFRGALIRVADEGLAKGLTIGEAFRRETVFPRVVVNLVAISEKAGHLSEVLGTLAEFYATSVDSRVRALTAILEPVLLIVMGVVVGMIALAIIVPIYQLTTQF